MSRLVSPSPFTLAEILERRGKPRLARAVVGVEQDEFLGLQLLPQMRGRGREARRRSVCRSCLTLLQRREELLQQALLVRLESVELSRLCGDEIVERGKTVGDSLLLGESRGNTYRQGIEERNPKS